ncbi:MAG TPA: pilus assembly protein PilB [Verrucomicrobia bacterium]|nr:pilus assembly protein PilB [Verrucomicrobiota bacterium]
MGEQSEYNDPLLELLVEQGFLTAEQMQEIASEHAESGKPIRNIVVDLGLIDADSVLEAIAGYMGTTVVNLPSLDIPQDVFNRVPASVARMYNVIPVSMTDSSIVLAVCDVVNPQVMDELMFVLTCDVSFVVAREEDVRAFLNQFYGDDSAAVNDMLSALEAADEAGELTLVDETTDEKGLEEAAGSTPVIRFVNLVLYQAVKDRASDIHFEPFEKEFRIRYRVDGALFEMAPPPKRLALPLISRIKVMANLNIAERRLPQDGRIQLSIGGRAIDLRVSSLPTQFGESVVLRVLDQSNVSLNVENLGMPDDVFTKFTNDIKKPNGIIIVTGPTGSGKTTTLYSGLKRVNTIDNKLLTAEEPVEYDIEGIIQVPVKESVGNSFAKILRAFLRQDPDIMMIGEIRDVETAQIAVQASLTGHLVFSTLHTNDAAGAVTRLVDMGIEPFLISCTLEAVLGQRLVRTICQKCRTPYQPEQDALDMLGLTKEDVGDRPFYYGAGCAECNDTGYRGRRGLYEYLSVTEPIRRLINERQPTIVIRDKAMQLGMISMRQHGTQCILDGYTTVDEVVKYT